MQVIFQNIIRVAALAALCSTVTLPVQAEKAPIIHPWDSPLSTSILAGEHQVNLLNWRKAPYNRLAFQRTSELMTTATVYRGEGDVLDFQYSEEGFDKLDNFQFEDFNGESLDWDAWLETSYTDGLLILKDGEILTEQYFAGMQPASRHLLFSVSKSITASVIGILAVEGLLDLDKSFSHYMPELRADASRKANPYADVTIQQALDMRSGVHFPYDYHAVDGNDRYDIDSGWAAGRSTWESGQFKYIQDLDKKDAKPGEAYLYKDIDTEMLGYVAEAVTGKRFAELLSEKIFQKLGAERDGNLIVDGAGSSIVAAGYSFTLRDLGRWTQMIANGGYFNGQQIVPQAFLKNTLQGYRQKLGKRRNDRGTTSYRNQFWLLDYDGAYTGLGLYGQLAYINPRHNIVIVQLSSIADLSKSDYHFATNLRAFKAITEYLAQKNGD